MNLKKRVAKLESQQTVHLPMVALQNEDFTFEWNGEIFENKAAFDKALRECEYTGKTLIIDI